LNISEKCDKIKSIWKINWKNKLRKSITRDTNPCRANKLARDIDLEKFYYLLWQRKYYER
jgi:hypothetical protein